MFMQAAAFNQQINDWNVSSVTNMNVRAPPRTAMNARAVSLAQSRVPSPHRLAAAASIRFASATAESAPARVLGGFRIRVGVRVRVRV